MVFNPYWSNVEFNWTALSTITAPMSDSNLHVILQCLMLGFPRLLLSSGCLWTLKPTGLLKINLNQTVGMHNNNLDHKGLNEYFLLHPSYMVSYKVAARLCITVIFLFSKQLTFQNTNLWKFWQLLQIFYHSLFTCLMYNMTTVVVGLLILKTFYANHSSHISRPVPALKCTLNIHSSCIYGFKRQPLTIWIYIYMYSRINASLF
jgi:hypothetical protein